MKPPVVIWGLGQMGGVFAHALLRLGHAVHPVTREVDPDALAIAVPEPLICLLAVGEDDLPDVVPRVPAAYRGRLGLVQNELLPHVWTELGIVDPTVAVVWFEKKKSVPLTPVQPTPIGGPRAGLLVDALSRLDVPAFEVPSSSLRDELVKKNLYILTANAAALSREVAEDVTVGELRAAHRPLVDAVAKDALAIQAHLTGAALSPELLAGLWEAFDADPHHRARGRSAAARLTRALSIADAAGLDVPALRALA
jgi:hypothetical protein